MSYAADRIRVLVVDDDARFRLAVRALLEIEGLEVAGEAENGLEAIELAAALRPDAITMDVEMPVMNGVDATAAICADRDHPPVVVVSGSRSAEHLDAALAAGARWFVAKADAPMHLPQVVRTAASEAPPDRL